jgi:hypothetical protein
MSEITAGRENSRGRPKGYADWRPQRKTQALLEQVGAVLAEYADHLPLTVRQIFYRLVAAFGYEKSERAYDRLAEMLVRARRARIVPFEFIRDDGVVTASFEFYGGVEDFWNKTGRRIQQYRRDRQNAQPRRIELWCEAAGMVPQLTSLAADYSIPVYSSGGFSSLSAVRAIVDRARDRDVPTTLLHVGDFDPSGESIFETMAVDAAAFLRKDRRIARLEIHSIRVALTAAQVDEYGLPTAPAKTTDSRTRNWQGETCQLEALAPDELATLITDTIENELDHARFDAEVEREHEDVVELWRGLPAGDAM